jgi:hypothetical protein
LAEGAAVVAVEPGAGWRAALAREFGSTGWLAAALLLAAAAGAFLFSQDLQPCDDAYITFRHARNLAREGRPAWNLTGPPVLGSTSPAWTLLLGTAGLALGSDRVDAIALPANALLMALLTLAAFLVARDLTGRPLAALLGAALVGFNSVNVFILSLGFEAGLLVLVLLAGLYLVRTGRDLPAVVAASVAPLVRPEGLLLSLLVWGVLLVRRRVRLRLLAAYAVVPAAWLAFSVPYYGSPVPQSIRARRAAPSVFRPFEGGEVDLGARLLRLGPETVRLAGHEAREYVFASRARAKDGPGGPSPATLALLGLPVLVVRHARRPDARLAYLLYAPLFLVLFAWIGWIEAWYLPSFVTFAVLTLFHGCIATLDALWDRARRPPPALGRRLSYAAAAVLLFSANAYAVGHERGQKGPVYARDPRGPMFERAERERFNGYRRVAGIMNRLGDAPRPVLTSEVGVFGFFYRGDVIDTVGLCTPEALAFYPPPPSDLRDESGREFTDSDNIAPTAMVLALKPAYVVNAAGYIRHLLRPESPFHREYAPLGTFGTAWGDELLVFERRASPPRGD